MSGTPISDQPIVFLLCGLTGSGKTTYAEKLTAEGVARLAVDERVFETYGAHGIDYPDDRYPAYERAAREELEQELIALLAAGRSVVLDYGFWKKSDRDRYKQLIESCGARWKLLFFKVPHDELFARLQQRNARTDANALTVTREMFFGDFIHRFEEPCHEGEEVITAA